MMIVSSPFVIVKPDFKCYSMFYVRAGNCSKIIFIFKILVLHYIV